MDAPAISVADLRVRRGGRLVLPGVSLAIAAGTVTGLLGPSGSGKTTLMRSIVGVQIVEAGAVTVLGLPAGSPPLRRRVGYVTQEPSVYGDMSVRENLRYFARILGGAAVAGRRGDRRGGSRRAGRPAHARSRAASAPVSSATALLGRPELLVLDEPTVGLDPVSGATSGRCSTGSPRRADAARLQPRDGRGRALRRARADARRPDRRRGSARRAASRTGAADLEPSCARGGSMCAARARDRRARAPAAPPRPARNSRSSSSCRRSAHALPLRLRRAAGDVRPGRRPARRHLPLHVDVPRHLDRDAARADERHARAADVDADREGRPARRLRARLRRRRGRAGVDHVRRRLRPAGWTRQGRSGRSC